jgi:hypothetical protein
MSQKVHVLNFDPVKIRGKNTGPENKKPGEAGLQALSDFDAELILRASRSDA